MLVALDALPFGARGFGFVSRIARRTDLTRDRVDAIVWDLYHSGDIDIQTSDAGTLTGYRLTRLGVSALRNHPMLAGGSREPCPQPSADRGDRGAEGRTP